MVGLAVTVVPIVAFKAVEGDQEYVKPPEAVKVVVEPGHIAAGDAFADTAKLVASTFVTGYDVV